MEPYLPSQFRAFSELSIKTIDIDIFISVNSSHDFFNFRSFIKNSGFKIKGSHVIIDDIPVHFIPGSLHPLINEAVRKGKRIRVNHIPTKVLTIEYLITLLLMAFRLKDRMVIHDLLELADIGKLKKIVERFSDEETPLDKDSKEFWKIFNQLRMKERKRLRSLSFRKKLEMMRIKKEDYS